MSSQTNLAERGMAVGLRALNKIASSDIVDRLGLRDQAERLLHETTKTTMRTAATAGRTFAAAQKLSRPARQPKARRSDLFDLTPTDEQQMLRDSVREFALAKLRPVAEAADDACEMPAELLSAANELGLSMVGVPEQLGGAVEERSAVTSVLMSEALAQGDMGMAVACLAPAGVSTALSLWGDADQQATYLPEFVGEDVPAAALALLEPRALFDPFSLQTRARAREGGYVLDGAKSLVPRAADGELFIVACRARGPRPGAVRRRSQGGRDRRRGAAGDGHSRRRNRRADIRRRAAARGRAARRRRPGRVRGVRRARRAWAGARWPSAPAQAVLDYVIPYVNERKAFGEPISNRQAVAFTVANIAIELEGMRLATYRAASRVDQDLSFNREVSIARRLCARARDGDRLRRRADARRPWIRKGPPRRALVPGPARRGPDRGRRARLMPINLETPKKFAGLVSQAHMVATEVFRPNSRKYDDAEHSYPKELDMLAAAIDGMNESGALGGAGAGAVGGNGNGNGRAPRRPTPTPTATAATWPACSA